ncbi:MAG TPA: hypothetical protein VG328_15120 [Stellaceae bacterium]|jgi:hypothetical protein|nr:hypothetical protein [Stellaceae bacterium]
MKLVHGGRMAFQSGQEKHRGGGLATKLLLAGEEGTKENFRLTLGRDRGGHQNPRHHHNFDQIRLSLQGSLSIAPGKELEEGWIGYFPEGTWYGPQAPATSERITLVLQFGGASGQGFISTRQMQQGYAALAKIGTFDAGVFHRTDGVGRKNQDAFEAIWEHVAGRPLAYPPPRYDEPILMNPAHFAWVPDRAQPGVARKLLGSFTERGTRIELLRLDKGARLAAGEADTRLLLFALSGAGEGWEQHAAFQIEPLVSEKGEHATIAATQPAELLQIALPMLG